METILIFGAFDTKGCEFLYLKHKIEEHGVKTLCLNTGMRSPFFVPDIDSEEVARAANVSIDVLRKADHGQACDYMKSGAAALIQSLYEQGRMDGVVTMGGGTGMYVARGVFARLPFGFPKAILSTHNTGTYGGYEKESVRDTISIKSLVDVAGLNPFMCSQMDLLAAVISGAVLSGCHFDAGRERKKIALSMLGITTKCVDAMARRLSEAGFEPVIFHANGDSGYQMERLIEEGCFSALADVTLAEIIPQFIPSGFGYAGEERMLAAGRANIPQLVIPGGMDVVNYPDGNHPAEYRGRTFHWHASSLEVMRTNVEENTLFGKVIAERVNTSSAPSAVVLPLRGVSENDKEGKHFYDPEANEALFRSIREHLRPDIPVYALDYHINDPEFAEAAAEILIDLCQ